METVLKGLQMILNVCLMMQEMVELLQILLIVKVSYKSESVCIRCRNHLKKANSFYNGSVNVVVMMAVM